MDLGMSELLVVLVIIILLFGVGRIANVAGELGKGIRSLQEGLNGSEIDETKPKTKEADQHEYS